jgi:hypothetical protein
LIGAEPTRGFLTFYGRFDLAQILHLCRCVGASLEDPALPASSPSCGSFRAVWALGYRATAGLALGHIFDLLRTLSQLDASGDWAALSPARLSRHILSEPRRY